MKTNELTVSTLKNLKREHKANWLNFYKKLESVLVVLGSRMSREALAELGHTVEIKWTSTEDISEHVTSADFVVAGYSEIEAAALVFVMTQECMGQACNTVENIDRWFTYEIR